MADDLVNDLLVPAWRGSRNAVLAGLKGDAHGAVTRRRPVGLVAQVVLSFVLLLIAATIIDTLRRLQTTDPGFAVSGRLYAYIFFPSAATPEADRQLYARTLDRLRALPGVISASQTSALPLMPSGTDCVSSTANPPLQVSTSAVEPGYFRTMGIGILAGRDFTTLDQRRDASTVVITDSLARRLWSDRTPIGERVLIGCEAPRASEVIGLVRDSAVRDVGEPPQPRIYRPFARDDDGGLSAVLIETGRDPGAMVASVHQTLLGMGQNIRVYAVQPLSAYIDQSFIGVRWMAMVLSGFGLLALGLAAVGLYGVIAYRVSLRTHEIGVRMALGAGRDVIFRDVLSSGVIIAVAGVVIGEGLAIPALRAIGTVQAAIRPAGPSAHVTAAAIWIAVALLACFLPANRAARVDPVDALRQE
jgi:putative ABC transport system permease protein